MKKHAYQLLLFLSSNNLHIYILLFFTNDLRWVNMDRAGKIPSPRSRESNSKNDRQNNCQKAKNSV